jgi:hypothetical protein
MTPEDPPPHEHTNATQPLFTGLAQRAGAILQRMELCTPPHSHHLTPLARGRGEDTTTPTSDFSAASSSSPSTPAQHQYNLHSTYQGSIHPNNSTHLHHTKFALPTPTREIYNMVLLSYSKEVGPIHVAQQAEDVIWSMIVRARQQEQQLPLLPVLLLLPSTENWNCVLKCWSRSSELHRSFYAYSFLQSWIEWNNRYQALLLHDEEGIATYEDDMMRGSKPNTESFRLVLQSCLVDDENISLSDNNTPSSFHHTKSSHAAKQIGSGVAIHLWKEMQKLENDSTSYLMLVQAICQTSELPTTVSTSKSLTALARIYSSCCKDGKLTDEISNLVEAATTKSQFTQLQSMVDTTTSASST